MRLMAWLMGLMLLTGCACSTDVPDAAQDVPVLKYYMVGNQDTDVREAVQRAISAYTREKIGAGVEFTIISWGDWDAKALTALQSGEVIDIIFTADWKSYVRSVTQNLFEPLNDNHAENGNLLAQYGQGILQTLEPAFLLGTQIGGVNYAVPTNKELCVPMGFVYNVDAAQEVRLEPDAITKLVDFEPYLARYKELYPARYGYLADGSRGDEVWVPGAVSNLNGNLISMKLEPDSNGVFDERWYSVWETEENAALAQLMYRWAQAGYVHPDAALSNFDVATSPEFAAGEWLFISAPLKGDNIKGEELVIASGNPALRVGEIYGQGKVIVTTHTGGSMLAIPTASDYPVQAMQFINLMHTDAELINRMLYGVPGEMWTLAADGRVQLNNSAWYSAHGGAWTMGNTALQYVTTQEDPEKNRKLQAYAADARVHPSLGFRYICPPQLEAQWAAVNNVQDAMNRSLLTGAVDPTTALPAYIRDLKAAGLDLIKADVEKQYRIWKNEQGR